MTNYIFTLKEIADEVDKLIKYTLEMKVITGYGKEKPINLQKLSLWSNAVKKGEK